MRLLLRFIPVIMLSIAIAVVVSLVPHIGSEQVTNVHTKHESTVTEVFTLSTYNLVDQFSELALHHKLDRIDWNGSTLHVELNVGDQLHSAQSVYADLFTLSAFSFSQADNVEKLLVRVLAGDDRGSRWIVLLNAGRSDWDSSEAELAAKDTDLLQSYMKKHFQFTMSPVWQKIEAL